MRKWIPVIAIAAIGAVSASAWWWNSTAPLRLAKDEVKLRLNDPDSAKFSELSFYPKTKATCGLVNAKNRMGGYTGNTHFILFPDGDLRFSENEEDRGTTLERLEIAKRRLAYSTLVVSNCKPA